MGYADHTAAGSPAAQITSADVLSHSVNAHKASVPTLAYLSAYLPALPETFVTREVRGLRRRGWQVQTVSLHETLQDDSLQDLRRDLIVVYGGKRLGLLGRA